jgi:hypothetical protein
MDNVPPQGKNQVMVIQPYRAHETWVFDDPVTGLVQEPFVAGIPEMIDLLVQGIPDASQGFRLLFSGSPIPGFQVNVDWVREDGGGHWYREPNTGMDGWLCPALFKYFVNAPATLYVKAESLGREVVVDGADDVEIERATLLLQEELLGAIARYKARAAESGISDNAINLAVTRQQLNLRGQ